MAQHLLMIVPTYRCNMNCKVCYVLQHDPSMDMSLEDIESILDKWPHSCVAFAGGEPTVMENLPEILQLAVAKGKRPSIITNGLKLADLRYMAHLVNCGLSNTVISLNALDRSVLEATDGQDTLDAKLRAISNLRKCRQPFTLTTSIVRGMNEMELGKVLRFALRNFPFARGVLVENCPGVGHNAEEARIHLSELVKLFAQSFEFDPDLVFALVEQESASLNVYALRFQYATLLRARAQHRKSDWYKQIQFPFMTYRDAGSKSALSQIFNYLGPRHHLYIRLLSALNTDNYDREETTLSAENRVQAVSKESSIMPLWEFMSRYHGTKPCETKS